MKITVPLLAVALQLAGTVFAQDDAAIAANLERFWSYGRSEPVYPTRKCDFAAWMFSD
jgi:beta-glucosidase